MAENEDKLVTIGITPTFPATGYGYIEFNKNEDSVAKKVIQFVEKPNLELAKEYVAKGSFAWNSGMFVGEHLLFSISLKNFCQMFTSVL